MTCRRAKLKFHTAGGINDYLSAGTVLLTFSNGLKEIFVFVGLKAVELIDTYHRY